MIKDKDRTFSEKQIHLIKTSEKLFAEVGYAETSLRIIAKESRMNSAMVSYYFGSKEKLMQAILEYRTINMAKVFNAYDELAEDPLNTILFLLDLYVDKIFEQKYFYRLLFQLQSTLKDESVMEHFNNMRLRNFKVLINVFQHGAEKGEFKSDIDTTFLLSTIYGSLNAMIFNKDYYRKVNGFDTLSDEDYVKLFKKRAKAHIRDIVLAIIKK
ncbi:TetR/AcrR family transcriptional regulator [Pedobacter antarcticus]|nr:TetR/AcrR family transcriptional regulator [Pedobacter antarcticus]SDM65234.1 transcriptional regulator, TetR family [Pedobacter antarcticus]SFF34296.1 transcriptional regulator, TetR family [Pedobacter antarcticus]